VVEELMIPGADTRSGMTSKFREHARRKYILEPSIA